MADKRVILLGQTPRKGEDPNLPLAPTNASGAAGYWLHLWSGLSPEDYLSVFDRRFMFAQYPGQTQNGLRFSRPKARRKAGIIVRGATGREIVLLGRKVAQAFSFDFVDPFVWQPQSGMLMAWMPHPTQVNRWWNEYGRREDARMFMRAVTQRALQLYRRR